MSFTFGDEDEDDYEALVRAAEEAEMSRAAAALRAPPSIVAPSAVASHAPPSAAAASGPSSWPPSTSSLSSAAGGVQRSGLPSSKPVPVSIAYPQHQQQNQLQHQPHQVQQQQQHQQQQPHQVQQQQQGPRPQQWPAPRPPPVLAGSDASRNQRNPFTNPFQTDPVPHRPAQEVQAHTLPQKKEKKIKIVFIYLSLLLCMWLIFFCFHHYSLSRLRRNHYQLHLLQLLQPCRWIHSQLSSAGRTSNQVPK